MPGGTGLDQATLIVYTEIATVDVAQMDLHSGKFVAKPLQNPIHFASDKRNHSRTYRYVFVAQSAHLPLFPPSLGRPKTFWKFDSRLELIIPFGG